MFAREFLFTIAKAKVFKLSFCSFKRKHFSYNCDLICNHVYWWRHVSFSTSSCSRNRLLQNADSENNDKMSGAHCLHPCRLSRHLPYFLSTLTPQYAYLLPFPCIVIWNNDFIPNIFFEWTWQELLLWRLLKYHLQMTSMLQNMITSF